jgi:hypothetical protein
MHRYTIFVCGFYLLAFSSLLQSESDLSGSATWSIAGQDIANSRSQPAEHKITTQNVASLAMNWVFTTASDVSATPTVDQDAVYFLTGLETSRPFKNDPVSCSGVRKYPTMTAIQEPCRG